MTTGTKISALSAAATLALTDKFPVVQADGIGPLRATLQQLETLLAGSFLGLTAQAADSAKLGGTAAASYAKISDIPSLAGYLTSATAASTYLPLAGGTVTGALTVSGAALTLSGNQSAAAWTTSGIKLKGGGSTLTDTTSSGTVALAVTDKLGGNTIAASSVTTFTNYASLYLDVPTAGSNVTITTPWSLYTTGAARVVGLTSAATATLNPAANTSALVASGYSLTGANAQSLLDLSGTWNTSGTPSGIKLAITDTASNNNSLLIDCTVGGANKFQVTKNGYARYTRGYFGIVGTQFPVVIFGDGGSNVGSVSLGTSSRLAFTSSTEGDGTQDTFLQRDAAGILAQRNGANAQTQRVYRSYTNGSNYSRLSHAWNTSTALVMADGAGTGTDGSVAFNDAALATDATVGFVMIPSCAGAPSGTPADIPTGQIPLVYDSTNNKIYAYSGSWRSVTVA